MPFLNSSVNSPGFATVGLADVLSDLTTVGFLITIGANEVVECSQATDGLTIFDPSPCLNRWR